MCLQRFIHGLAKPYFIGGLGKLNFDRCLTSKRPRFAGSWREDHPGRIGLETEGNSKGVWIKQSILCGAGIAINPGLTVTERLQQALKIEAETRGLSEEAVLARAQAKIPLRRCAAPDEIANLALFLASDKAGYLTGAIIPMDGGSNPVL